MKQLILFLFLIGFTSQAQKSTYKFNKVSRDVKKEAKRYTKEGWFVFPGNPPIEQQLNQSFIKQSEADKDGFPIWLVANGSSLGQTLAAAEMQALELAKNSLVGLMETNLKSVIETDISNNQLNAEEAISLTKTMQVSTNKVSKKLGRVTTLLKIYRKINNNFEVQVMIGYNYDLVRKLILEEMKTEMQNETKEMRDKFDKYLNPELYNEGEIKNYDEN
jgi:hypothetical protein